MHDLSDYFMAFVAGTFALLLLGFVYMLGHLIYWDVQAKQDCIRRGIPIAACAKWGKQDISVEVN
jgi:hypothetical protein